MTYHLGARRSHPDKLARARPAHSHPAIRAALAAQQPTSVDLGQYSPPIFDQGATGSCTAHAIAGGIYTVLAAAGRRLDYVPSPDAIYKQTRARARALAALGSNTLPELTDSGAEVADVIGGLSENGIRPIKTLAPDGRYSDVDPTTVNDEPALMDLEIGANSVLAGPYAVEPTQANATEVYTAALTANIELDIAFFVDSAFMNLQSGQIAGAPDQNDPNGGGHSVRLSGFQVTPTGTLFILTNSWGSGWCNNGRCLVGPAFMAAVWEVWPVAITAEAA